MYHNVRWGLNIFSLSMIPSVPLQSVITTSKVNLDLTSSHLRSTAHIHQDYSDTLIRNLGLGNKTAQDYIYLIELQILRQYNLYYKVRTHNSISYSLRQCHK